MKSKSFLKAAKNNFNGTYNAYELNDEEFDFYKDWFLIGGDYEDFEEARTLALLLCIQLMEKTYIKKPQQFDYMSEVNKIILKAAKVAFEMEEFETLKDAKNSIKESIAENLLEEIER